MIEQQWLAWWHSGYWQAAHESWRQDSWFSLPEQRQQALVRLRSAAVGRQWDVEPGPVAPPQPLLLTLLALPEPLKTRLLMLTEAICGAETGLPGEEKIWCRRLSKGMRPESWLPDAFYQQPAALLLLQALYPTCWSRLRMAFARDEALACPPMPLAIPARRLQPIWEAALWRCQTGESNDVAA